MRMRFAAIALEARQLVSEIGVRFGMRGTLSLPASLGLTRTHSDDASWLNTV